jgi:hypothetical protein
MYSLKTKKKSGQIIKGIVVLVGFTLNSPHIFAQPKEATSVAVESCNYFDTIEGSSGYGKKFEWKSYAKLDAINKATEKGASHIVWERFTPVGAFNGVAVAKVYKCNT